LRRRQFIPQALVIPLTLSVGLTLLGCQTPKASDLGGGYYDTGYGGYSNGGGNSSGGGSGAESSYSGEELYNSFCASCHAVDGSGTSAGSALDELNEMSDGELADIIIYGEYEMPGFPSLSDGEVDDIIVYMRDTFGGGVGSSGSYSDDDDDDADEGVDED